MTTRGPELSLLAQLVETGAHLAGNLSEATAELQGRLPLGAGDPRALPSDTRLRIDAFLKRWEQLQDFLANRLLRAIFAMLLEPTERMSARSAFNRAASLGVLHDERRFIAMQELRNRLAHEYPMSDAKRAARINDAWAFAPALLEEHDRMAAYARRLLADGDQA